MQHFYASDIFMMVTFLWVEYKKKNSGYSIGNLDLSIVFQHDMTLCHDLNHQIKISVDDNGSICRPVMHLGRP